MWRKCTKIRVRNLPVTSHSLKVSVVSAERDVEPDDGLASLDEVEVLLINASHNGSLVVEELDLLKETRLEVLVELRSKLGKHGHGANG